MHFSWRTCQSACFPAGSPQQVQTLDLNPQQAAALQALQLQQQQQAQQQAQQQQQQEQQVRRRAPRVPRIFACIIAQLD